MRINFFQRVAEVVRVQARSVWRRPVAWWRRKHDAHGLAWRIVSFAAVGSIVGGIVAPVVGYIGEQVRYTLSSDTVKLVGHTDAALSSKLKYDAATKTYLFNQDAISSSPLPSEALKNSAGAANKSNTKAYALKVSADMAQGVKYYDTNSQLSFRLVPQFAAQSGKMKDGHLVYPIDQGIQAVYTLKNNGLKEDIVVPEATRDTLKFAYKLDLPSTLEARVIPGSGGVVGVYSADPALFGQISYGSKDDEARVQKARENGAKNTLVFGLPAPVIKAANGKTGAAVAHFELHDGTLTVVAEHLQSVSGALTIDPSVVVTSTSDFQTAGNNDGMIDFSTSGQLNRGGLTSGSLGAYVTSNGAGTPYASNTGIGAAVYNGFMYVHSIIDANIHYVALNASDGTLGTWVTGTSFTNRRQYAAMQAYNGYLYIYGGNDAVSNTNTLSDVQYAVINSDGSVGTWNTSSNAMVSAVCRFSSTVYNGYLYAIGGATGTVTAQCANSSTATTITQYAPILANGDVGPWASATNAITTARMSGGTVANNGFIYVLGGCATGGISISSALSSAYAPLRANGDIGAWQSTTGLVARYRFGIVQNNGYIYALGGGAGGVATGDTVYARMNANGSLGPWQATSSFTDIQFGAAAAVYNGYLYKIGGNDANGTGHETQLAPFDAAGNVNGFTTSSGTAFTTTRRGMSTVAYGGFIYAMGGDNATQAYATVYRATLGADGTIGNFSATASFTSNRTFMAAVAYEGYMYVFGGCTSVLASCTTAANNINTVYSSLINGSTGSLGTFTNQTNVFTTARYGHSAVVYGGQVYIMGGLNGSTFQSDVQYASLSAGTVSTWTTATSFPIPTARAGFGLAINGGYVYLAGGCSAGNLATCTTRRSDVQYAQLTSTGGFATSWASGTSFTNARYGASLVANAGFLYLIGGYDNTTYYSDIQYVNLTSSGSLGSPWLTADATLSSGRYGVGAAAYDGLLYVQGGYNGTTYYNDTQYAFIDNGGQPTNSAWTTNATDLSSLYADWEYGAMFASNGFLYLVGGYTAGPPIVKHADVYYAPIGDDGSVGSFTATTSMNTDRIQFSIAVYNGYVYVMDGQVNGSYVSSVDYAPINPSGGVGTWISSTTTGKPTVAPARSHSAATAYNGYIYMAGGQTSGGASQSDVQYAQLNADGSTGAWATTTSFTNGRRYLTMTANNGYLYILGGADASTSYDDVQYGAISGGTVASWSYTSELPFTLESLKSFVVNGYMYIVTGLTNVFAFNRLAWAPINPNGTLGTWQLAPNTFTTQRHFNGVAYDSSNGTIYFAGGQDNTATFKLDIQYAPLLTVARSAQYTKVVDLGSAQSVSSISYNGALTPDPEIIGGVPITVKMAPASGVWGSQVSAANVAAGSTACITPTRYLFIGITLNDSMSNSVFPDSLGTPASVTDFTANYTTLHPVSNIRLRLGRTLQSGALSPLDTCYP